MGGRCPGEARRALARAPGCRGGGSAGERRGADEARHREPGAGDEVEAERVAEDRGHAGQGTEQVEGLGVTEAVDLDDHDVDATRDQALLELGDDTAGLGPEGGVLVVEVDLLDLELAQLRDAAERLAPVTRTRGSPEADLDQGPVVVDPGLATVQRVRLLLERVEQGVQCSDVAHVGAFSPKSVLSSPDVTSSFKRGLK